MMHSTKNESPPVVRKEKLKRGEWRKRKTKNQPPAISESLTSICMTMYMNDATYQRIHKRDETNYFFFQGKKEMEFKLRLKCLAL